MVDGLPRTTFSGDAFRHQGPGHPPLNAEGARIHGGRWNPPDSFPVLYLALDVATAVAEFYRLAERNNMWPSSLLPRRLYRYAVELSAVADLTSGETLSAVGLSEEDVRAEDPQLCRDIGAAARAAGFEAIKAPSATGTGEILAVMFERIAGTKNIVPLSFDTWEAPPRFR